MDCKLNDPAASLSGKGSSAASLENCMGLDEAMEIMSLLPYQESKVGLLQLTRPPFEGGFCLIQLGYRRKNS